MIRVLEQVEDIVRRKWPKDRRWKVAFVVGLVVLAILGVVIVVIWSLGKLVKSLAAGGFRNKDLYIPRMRRRL